MMWSIFSYDYFHIYISSLVRCLLMSLAHFLNQTVWFFFVVESSVWFSCSVMSDCLWPCGLQHAFCLFFCFFFLAMLHGKQDLSSLTRGWTWVPCSGSMEPYPLNCKLGLFHSVTLSCLTLCDPKEFQVVLRVLFTFSLSDMSFVHILSLSVVYLLILDTIFSRTEVSNFSEVQLINYFFYGVCLWCCVWKQITTPEVI